MGFKIKNGVLLKYEGAGALERLGIRKQDETVSIPKNVSEIADEAFSMTDVSRVFLPPNVSLIGERAFALCAELQTVDFSGGLKEIGTNAFDGCHVLRSAVIPETDNIGVYGGGENRVPEFSGISLRASGTYGEDTLDGGLTAEIEFAGGELTQSFGIRCKAERETPRGPVTFEITPGPELGGDVKITGKTEAADYAPGEYDPKDAIRYSEAEGEDKERFDKFTEELTDALSRFGDAMSDGLGLGFAPNGDGYMSFDLYLTGGEDEFYALNNYMSGYYIKDLAMTLEDGVATVETPDGTLVLDLELRPETVKIGDATFTCEYSDTDDCVFASARREGEDDLYSPSYSVALYDDPDMADLTGASFNIWFDFEREGDEFICHLPDGDLTFTYREGDETVLIGGVEFETSVYGYGGSD